MKRRAAKKPPEPARRKGLCIEFVPLSDSVRLVTLDDPSAPVQAAHGAFARLRPPEGQPADETQSWAASVRAIARAVRVLPVRHGKLVPEMHTRVCISSGGIREESIAIVGEMGKGGELLAFVEQVLAEVERP